MKPLLPSDFILPKLDIPTEKNSEWEEGRVKTPHLSFSAMSMYLRCPAQFRYRYVDGLRERPKVSLALGKGGHTALEFDTKRKLATGQNAPTEEVLQVASDQMDIQLQEMPPSEYEKDVEPGMTKDRYLSATKIYHTRDAPNITPVSAELAFALDVNKFLPDDEKPIEPIRIIEGKIDVLYLDRETFFGHPQTANIGVEDYKFIGKRKPIAEVNLTPQLTTYAAVVKDRTGKWPSKLGIRQMLQGSTAKTPKPENGPDSEVLLREPQYMTPVALETRVLRLARQYRDVEKGIANDIFTPTDNPMTCSWCGYRDRCQDSLVTEAEVATIRAKASPQPS